MTTIRGQIRDVLESWPLQLIVTSGDQRYEASLTGTTRISQGGMKVDPGRLRPDMWVTLSGEAHGSTILVESITID